MTVAADEFQRGAPALTGWRVAEWLDTIRYMPRKEPAFKETQIFGWDQEPKEDRPSEFIPSTGYSSLSGYYSMPDSAGVAVRGRRRGRFNGLIVASLAVVGLGAAGLIGLLHLLRG